MEMTMTYSEWCVLAAYLFIIAILGTAGNALVLIVFYRKKDKQVSTFFIITLALVDLSACLLLIPTSFYLEYHDYHIQSDLVCKGYQVFNGGLIHFSALIMVAIALERYLCICHPFVRVLTLRRSQLLIGVMAAIATILGLLMGFTYGITTQTIPLNDANNSSITHSNDGGLVGFTTTSAFPGAYGGDGDGDGGRDGRGRNEGNGGNEGTLNDDNICNRDVKNCEGKKSVINGFNLKNKFKNYGLKRIKKALKRQTNSKKTLCQNVTMKKTRVHLKKKAKFHSKFEIEEKKGIYDVYRNGRKKIKRSTMSQKSKISHELEKNSELVNLGYLANIHNKLCHSYGTNFFEKKKIFSRKIPSGKDRLIYGVPKLHEQANLNIEKTLKSGKKFEKIKSHEKKRKKRNSISENKTKLSTQSTLSHLDNTTQPPPHFNSTIQQPTFDNTTQRPTLTIYSCELTYEHLSKEFVKNYSKFANALFLIYLAIVSSLYLLLYKSVMTRRSKRQQQKSACLQQVRQAQEKKQLKKNHQLIPNTQLIQKDDGEKKGMKKEEKSKKGKKREGTKGENYVKKVDNMSNCVRDENETKNEKKARKNSNESVKTNEVKNTDINTVIKHQLNSMESLNDDKLTFNDKKQMKLSVYLNTPSNLIECQDNKNFVKNTDQNNDPRLQTLNNPTQTDDQTINNTNINDLTNNNINKDQKIHLAPSITRIEVEKEVLEAPKPQRSQQDFLNWIKSLKRNTKLSKKKKVVDGTMMANLKTASMLFVVTVVFFVSFIPAFLNSVGWIEGFMFLFYVYFANNAANPIIYSFMNRNFRVDLKKLFK